ncbi:hypothetical protein Pan44_23100 [Caulifigura coniformis]|uniref:Uncharacterized protein n=1 Tax=Caulifigura coniformis TaxID=2527983 RepID=A0A517SDS8_9PLAN|nr:hypothetical protein [Caulifigura coniformis]QDT54282.1 hypothetical protein Pan44_23100 [Caulifigura coniformis]
MTVDEFVTRGCVEGQSRAWDVATTYLKATGRPVHEGHVRGVVFQLRHWTSPDPAFLFLRPATVGEVVDKFLTSHPPIPGRLTSVDDLVKAVTAWCPSVSPRWQVRHELTKRLTMLNVVVVHD